MFSQSSGLHSIRSYCYQYTFMIHFEINKPWEQLKHLDFNCFIANQFNEFYLKWSIAAYASPYKCGTRRCDLCLTEK